MLELNSPSGRELRNFSVNSAKWFNDAPEKRVSFGGVNASLSPSPNDIPTRIEIVLLEPRGDNDSGSVLARLTYPNDSEPMNEVVADSATAYIGDKTSRIFGIQATTRNDVNQVGFEEALAVLVSALSVVESTIDANKMSEFRKLLNIQLMKRIFSSLTSK